MSKSEGKKIAIKFTEDIVGLVKEPESVHYTPMGIATASNQYSSYSPDRAFMEDTQYWYTRIAPVWIQIELDNPIHLKGFRWDTKTSSYRPRNFVIQGSNDGEIWNDLYQGESPTTNGWKEFSWVAREGYKFYRWDISTKWSSYIYIYQIELLEASGNLDAFLITGKEYKYVQGPNFNGELIDKEYIPISVEEHPTINKAILLSFPTFEEFNSVVGDITIAYDAQIGNLSGRGGRVDSFTVSLSPLDLIATPNPGVTEFITVAPMEIIGDLMEIEYIDRYSEDHTITVAPVEITGTLVHISEVNP